MALRAGRLDVASGAKNFRLLAAVGAHPVRDAPARDTLKAKSGRSPSATESLFSCVAKRKVTKREGHPAWRLPDILSGKSVRRGRAFRQHIHVLAKRSRPPVDSRCAACRPRLTAAQGPRVEQRAILARTRCAAAARLRGQRQRRRQWQRPGLWGSPVFDLDFASALLKSARRSAPLYPGPLCGGAGQTKGPQGDRQGCRSFFARTGVLSKNPAGSHGLAEQGCPASAKRGGLLFGYFLLATQEKVTRPPQEDESSLLWTDKKATQMATRC